MTRHILTLLLLAAVALAGSAQISRSRSISLTPTFSRYAKDYVEERINAWQKRGEFEKAEAYRTRILTQRDARIEEYTEQARLKYIADLSPANLKAELTLGNYNPDAEVFVISHPKFGDLIVSIDTSAAPDFKSAWYQMKAEPKYVIQNDRLALASVTFRSKGGRLKKPVVAVQADATEYAVKDIEFSFDPIEIETDAPAPSPRKETAAAKAPAPSDVDTNIPKGNGTVNANTFAVVIANENYKRVSKVDYAHNDGETMAKYLNKTLGVPSEQIHIVKDATLNDMHAELLWMEEVAKAYGGEASFIFYYAGHGVPDEATGEAFLLPADGFGTMASSGLSLASLNEKMASLPSRLTVMLLDACFSGAMRSGDMIASTRGVAVKPRKESLNGGNVVALTASQNDETATKIDEYGHGLFTYFVLKKLQESKGNLSLGDLADYVKENVGRQSVVRTRKPQTPAVLHSPSLTSRWPGINLSHMSK